MFKNGPIVVIDDDDILLLEEIFENIKYKNEIKYFSDGHIALKFLQETTALPFLILSDEYA